MIRVEKVSREWAATRVSVDKEIVDLSLEIWAVWDRDELALVGGVVRLSMLGTKRIWLQPFAPTFAVLRNTKQILCAVVQRFGGVEAVVEPGRNQRFAEFCGFRVVESGELVRVQTWL